MTTGDCDSLTHVNTTSDMLPDDVDALKAALLAERAARREFEARASGAEAMVAHLKLLIAKISATVSVPRRNVAASGLISWRCSSRSSRLEELETSGG
jgi:hypothetical protein